MTTMSVINKIDKLGGSIHIDSDGYSAVRLVGFINGVRVVHPIDWRFFTAEKGGKTIQCHRVKDLEFFV